MSTENKQTTLESSLKVLTRQLKAIKDHDFNSVKLLNKIVGIKFLLKTIELIKQSDDQEAMVLINHAEFVKFQESLKSGSLVEETGLHLVEFQSSNINQKLQDKDTCYGSVLFYDREWCDYRKTLYRFLNITIKFKDIISDKIVNQLAVAHLSSGDSKTVDETTVVDYPFGFKDFQSRYSGTNIKLKELKEQYFMKLFPTNYENKSYENIFKAVPTSKLIKIAELDSLIENITKDLDTIIN